MKTKFTPSKKALAKILQRTCKQLLLISSLFLSLFAKAQNRGPSTDSSPYVIPVAAGVQTTSFLTANDSINGYPMVGVPDGLGAFDNGDGTFTLLSNHELLSTEGRARAHGSPGAFVSKWIIKKSDLTVLSGTDLMKLVFLWNFTFFTSYDTTRPSPLTAFGRFCSGDLPAPTAFYNSKTGRGTQERIYMNGEEVSEGRAFGHVVTGPNTGTSYQLPWLGRMSFENSVANPYQQDKTIVGCMDDASTTTSNVYFYVGQKTKSGNEFSKAGLFNGKLYAVKVTGFPQERISSTVINDPPAAGTHFDLVYLGDVIDLTGAQLDSVSTALGATRFSRCEDGAWNPSAPTNFYFNTTDQLDQVSDGVGTQVGRSRLWHLHFDDIAKPEAGGTIEAALDGTEGQNMLDNMAIDKFGHIVLLEDVGNSPHNGKVWLYDIASDNLTMIAKHDPARFGDVTTPATLPFTQDEETSGVIDVSDILGPNYFLLDDQAHYRTDVPPDIVEGGQYLALFIQGLCHAPDAPKAIKNGTKTNLCPAGDFVFYVSNIPTATSYRWTVPAGVTSSTSTNGDTITLHTTAGFIRGDLSVVAVNNCGTSNAFTTTISALPSKPSVSGPACVSANQAGLIYSIVNPGEGLTFTWSVPLGATIVSGQGTSQVTVNWKSNTGNISVLASNTCGASGKTYYAVTVNCGIESSITKAELYSNETNVYPNPTTGKVNVQFNALKPGRYVLEIYDINSRMLQKKEVNAIAGTNINSLDLRNLSKGTYLLKISSDSNVETRKIVVER
jgi:hypothetical protein